MFECEVKYVVRDAKKLKDSLRRLSKEEPVEKVYCDEYYDYSDRRLSISEREIRLRCVNFAGAKNWMVTAKASPFDSTSKSKLEFQSEVASPDHMREILAILDMKSFITFEKRILLFRFQYALRWVEAIIVEVPELPNTYAELEILNLDAKSAINDIALLRQLARELGLVASDETAEYYTDMVYRNRVNP